MNVLIVDDEPLARERLSRMVGELDGYRVLEPSASNGEEALTLIDSLKPDIVLLDIRMPGLDGLQLCQQLRERASRYIPVLMLTGDGRLDRLQTVGRCVDGESEPLGDPRGAFDQPALIAGQVKRGDGGDALGRLGG